MRKSNGKLFLYELKKTFLIPSLLVGIYLLVALFDTVVFNVGAGAARDYDRYSHIFLYVFYAVVLTLFIYRVFTMRKLYEKMRIAYEKLFWIHVLYIFTYCFLCTTALLLVGTLRVYKMKNGYYAEYVGYARHSLFALQGKTKWYFLFGASVGLTGVITYSVAVFIQHLFVCRDKWYFKAVWGCVFAAAILSTHFVITRTYTCPALGNNEGFATPLPYGGMSYQTYKYFFEHGLSSPFDPFSALLPSAEILRCDLCWNIANPWVLLSSLFVIVFAFVSIGFLHRAKNANYAYTVQKEKNNEIEN